MAFKATKDTYGFEQVGPDIFVRREIKAGAFVPDGLFADEDGSTPLDTEEVEAGPGPAYSEGLVADDTVTVEPTEPELEVVDEPEADPPGPVEEDEPKSEPQKATRTKKAASAE